MTSNQGPRGPATPELKLATGNQEELDDPSGPAVGDDARDRPGDAARLPDATDRADGETDNGPKRNRWASLAKQLFLLSTLAIWGLSGGLLTQLYLSGKLTTSSGSPELEGQAPAVRPVAQPLPIATAVGGTSHVDPLQVTLAEADDWLISGDPQAALAVYQAHAERRQEAEAVPQELQFRIAACLEALGRLDDAMDQLRGLAERASNAVVRQASRISQARIWMRKGELETSQSLSCQVLQNPSSTALRGSAQRLLAESIARQAFDQQELTRTSLRHLAVPPIAFAAEDLLRQLVAEPARGKPAAREPSVPASGVAITSRFGDRPEDLQVVVAVARTPLREIVDRLTKLGGMHVTWSDIARHVVQDRTGEFTLEESSLGEVLDLILVPLGLSWEFTDGRLAIASWRELSPQQARARRTEIAERNLQRAIATFPEHRQTSRSYLWLGNLAFQQDRLELAASYFEQIERQFPRSAIANAAQFNFAKSQFLQGQTTGAREAFYRVVDRGRGESLEATAYLFLGRLHIESGASSEAVDPLVRAISLATDDTIRSTSVLTLASAYLMLDNSHAAISTLMDYRADVALEPHRKIAGLLTALGRFRVAHGKARHDVGRMLVAAVAQVEPKSFFGSHGYLMVGESYHRLGFLDQVERIYVAGLADADVVSDVRLQLATRLADHYLAAGKLGDAQRVLDELVDAADAAGDQGAKRKAKVHLAEVLYQNKQLDRCLSTCEQLLEGSQEPAEKAQLLKLMGRVYQQKQDHYRAALCFSGLVPGSAEATLKEAP